MPPLTCNVSPVTYEAWSEDKNATQFDTSSPVPSLPIGILEVKYNFTFSAIFMVILETIKNVHFKVKAKALLFLQKIRIHR